MMHERTNPNHIELKGRLRKAVMEINRQEVSAESISRVAEQARKLEADPPFTVRKATSIGWRRTARGLVACAAVAVAAIIWWQTATPRAWAEVVDAVKAQQWVHMQGKMLDGTPVELWVSSSEEVLAQKVDNGATILDWSNNTQVTYNLLDVQDDTVYRLPLETANRQALAEFETTLDGLMKGNIIGGVSAEGDRIERHKVETVDRDGKKRQRHELLVTAGHGEQKIERIIVLFVDPVTGLPEQMKVSISAGEQTIGWEVAWDYPQSGPLTIYALGAPKSANVVDQVPNDDLKTLLAGVEASRKRLDGYRAISIQTNSSDSGDYNTADVLRIWRKGSRWRVEKCRIPRENFRLLQPPADADPHKWWQESAAESDNWLRAVADGERECVYIARYAQPRVEDPDVPGYMEIKSFDEKCKRMLGEYLPADWDRFPCFRGYPRMYETTRAGWTAKVIPTPKQGPKGSVLIECRRRGDAEAREMSVHRYWIDPAQSHLVVREELIYGDPENPSKRGVVEVAEVGRTPSGLAYPKLVRFPNSSTNLETGERSDFYYRFFVDFDVEVAEELFSTGR